MLECMPWTHSLSTAQPAISWERAPRAACGDLISKELST